MFLICKIFFDEPDTQLPSNQMARKIIVNEIHCIPFQTDKANSALAKETGRVEKSNFEGKKSIG